MTREKSVITNEDLIKSLSKERQESINNEVKKNISKWGGARIGAGRKPSNNVLKFTRRLSEKENKYIDYSIYYYTEKSAIRRFSIWQLTVLALIEPHVVLQFFYFYQSLPRK